MDKFYLVMPVNDDLSGSEGTPIALPASSSVEVCYTRLMAEGRLLEQKKLHPKETWAIFEATFYAAESAYKHGIYSVTPTVPDYQDHPAYVEYMRNS